MAALRDCEGCCALRSERGQLCREWKKEKKGREGGRKNVFHAQYEESVCRLRDILQVVVTATASGRSHPQAVNFDERICAYRASLRYRPVARLCSLRGKCLDSEISMFEVGERRSRRFEKVSILPSPQTRGASGQFMPSISHLGETSNPDLHVSQTSDCVNRGNPSRPSDEMIQI
jgi:hypothetical protein